MNRLSLSDFYRDVRTLKEPTEVAVQGKVVGTFYPAGVAPHGIEVEATIVRSHREKDGTRAIDEVRVTGASLVKTLATQERTAAAQRQRDAWLRKLAPARERSR